MTHEGTLQFPNPYDRMATGHVDTRIANFPAQPEAQSKTNWCWVAVCQAILASHQTRLTQIQVVTKCTPGKEQKNEAYFLDIALEDLGASVKYLTINAMPLDVPQYCTSQEVGIQISWNDGSNIGHAICAFGTGTIDGKQALLIYDPQAPRASATGTDLIKLVPIDVFSEPGFYLENSTQNKFGKWVGAVRVDGYTPK